MDGGDDLLDLIDTVAELRDAHGVQASYNQIHRACIDGAVPATRARGRWRLRRCDLPRVAEALAGGPRRRARDGAAEPLTAAA